MAMYHTGFFHHIGTFLLLLATVLLIITDISAPVVHDIGILKVDLGNSNNGNEVSFGTFGYCIINNGYGASPATVGTEKSKHVLTRLFSVNNPDSCSPSVVGYNPTSVMAQTDGTSYSDNDTKVTNSLTKAMILHPIATGLCFIAFFMALGAGVVGSFLASLVSLLAFIVSLVALIIDFVLFSVIKDKVNNQSTDGTRAFFSIAIWTILASAICSFLGAIVVFITCCSGRLHRRRERSKAEGFTSPPAGTYRRRWWSGRGV